MKRLFLITSFLPLLFLLFLVFEPKQAYAQNACLSLGLGCSATNLYPQNGGAIHLDCDNNPDGSANTGEGILVEQYSCSSDGSTRYLTTDKQCFETYGCTNNPCLSLGLGCSATRIFPQNGGSIHLNCDNVPDSTPRVPSGVAPTGYGILVEEYFCSGDGSTRYLTTDAACFESYGCTGGAPTPTTTPIPGACTNGQTRNLSCATGQVCPYDPNVGVCNLQRCMSGIWVDDSECNAFNQCGSTCQPTPSCAKVGSACSSDPNCRDGTAACSTAVCNSGFCAVLVTPTPSCMPDGATGCTANGACCNGICSGTPPNTVCATSGGGPVPTAAPAWECLLNFSLSGCVGNPSVPSGGRSKVLDIINFVIYILAMLGIILAIGFLIWAAILWITSGGDKQKLESARKTVVFAIVGLIIVLWAFIIVYFLGNILKAKFLTTPGLP